MNNVQVETVFCPILGELELLVVCSWLIALLYIL
jgi:hypothetical protein